MFVLPRLICHTNNALVSYSKMPKQRSDDKKKRKWNETKITKSTFARQRVASFKCHRSLGPLELRHTFYPHKYNHIFPLSLQDVTVIMYCCFSWRWCCYVRHCGSSVPWNSSMIWSCHRRRTAPLPLHSDMRAVGLSENVNGLSIPNELNL